MSIDMFLYFLSAQVLIDYASITVLGSISEHKKSLMSHSLLYWGDVDNKLTNLYAK